MYPDQGNFAYASGSAAAPPRSGRELVELYSAFDVYDALPPEHQDHVDAHLYNPVRLAHEAVEEWSQALEDFEGIQALNSALGSAPNAGNREYYEQ